MIVYRIGDCRYINDLSGKGAALYGARWNSTDIHMLYTAQSPALALLEAVVHIGKMPNKNYCMAMIEMPGHSVTSLDADMLPADWHFNPAPVYLKMIGDNFISAAKYLALKVPSVVMTEESNYLLNPAHPLFSKVNIISQKVINIDQRLYPA
jgi:RES domain-containing protein